MDGVAAAAYRAKKAAEQHQRREDEAAVRSCLDRIIVRVERQAWAQPSAHQWQCPAGCTNCAPCARVSFRQQCLPSSDSVSSSLRHLWEGKRATPFGRFVAPSGYRYGFAEQVRCSTEQAEELARKAPSFEVSDSELIEIQAAFLTGWDGIVEPDLWLLHWLEHATHLTGFGDEYRGKDLGLSADQFGPDHHPVGPAACARSECSGCCFCKGAAPRPVYLQVRSHAPTGKKTVWCRKWVDHSGATAAGDRIRGWLKVFPP